MLNCCWSVLLFLMEKERNTNNLYNLPYVHRTAWQCRDGIIWRGRTSQNVMLNIVILCSKTSVHSTCWTIDTRQDRCWTEVLCFFHFLSAVLIRDEEPDPASRAHPEEGRQRGCSIRFLSPAALEESRGSLKPTTLHLGGQYVSHLWIQF